MKNKLTAFVCGSILTLGMALPSLADCKGMCGDMKSYFGSTTAFVVDVPEGVLLDSLWRSPVKVSRSLADKFGDPNGLSQRLAGAAIGIPVGIVWGVPHGAICGGRQALSAGWDEPFSTSSYIVADEK